MLNIFYTTFGRRALRMPIMSFVRNQDSRSATSTDVSDQCVEHSQVVVLSNNSQSVIGIMAVDNLHVDSDDLNRLQRIESGSISYEQAIQEVSQLAFAIQNRSSKVSINE
ncbi:hypothetical protein DT74_04155 [Acinetobacter sp. ETR1]|nr:hypothetical protein DT74_04155 [Acinetobacter sp. ETR1]